MPLWLVFGLQKREERLWVFGAWHGNAYSDNARAVFECVLAEYHEITPVWITQSKDIFERLSLEQKPVAMMQSREGRKYCRKAKYYFITVETDDIDRLRVNGAKQIWLWHGMPIKLIRHDRSKQTPSGWKWRMLCLFPQNARSIPDALISIHPFWNNVFESAFKISDRQSIKITGLPRNDVFWRADSEQLIVDLRNTFSNANVVLYMPTFRDSTTMYEHKAFNPFSSFGFDSSAFLDFIERNNMIFLYKGHYYDLQLPDLNINNNPRFVVLDDSKYTDLYLLMKDVDILITDYSSVYFDFLLLGKPVVLAPFDYDDYIKNSRDIYFNYNECMSAVKAYNWNDVMDILEFKKYWIPESDLNKYHIYKDDNSARRVINMVLDDMKK